MVAQPHHSGCICVIFFNNYEAFLPTESMELICFSYRVASFGANFSDPIESENSGYISHHLMHHLTKVALSWTSWMPKLVEPFDPVYPDGPHGL